MQKCKTCSNCLIRIAKNVKENENDVAIYYCKILGQDPSYVLTHFAYPEEPVSIRKEQIGTILNCTDYQKR